jgi:uncharacterized protein YkwD
VDALWTLGVGADEAGMALTFRPTRLLALPLTCCTILVMPSGVASAAGCANETLIPDATNTALIREATRCLINQERARVGRKPLVASPALIAPAQAHAKQMVKEHYFDHVSPTGSSLLSRVKLYSNYANKHTTVRYTVGENIAWGSFELASPLEIIKSWMCSRGHRDNILDRRYRDVGVGVTSGAPEDVGNDLAGTYSTVFGQRSKR